MTKSEDHFEAKWSAAVIFNRSIATVRLDSLKAKYWSSKPVGSTLVVPWGCGELGSSYWLPLFVEGATISSEYSNFEPSEPSGKQADLAWVVQASVAMTPGYRLSIF